MGSRGVGPRRRVVAGDGGPRPPYQPAVQALAIELHRILLKEFDGAALLSKVPSKYRAINK